MSKIRAGTEMPPIGCKERKRLERGLIGKIGHYELALYATKYTRPTVAMRHR